MRVNIFGLGNVGTTALLGLARRGFPVFGIETDPKRLESFRQRLLPIYEPGLEETWKELLARDAPIWVQNPSDERLLRADVSLVCVGTPSLPDGRVDLSQIRAVLPTLAKIIGHRPSHKIFFRSTVPPGTTRGILIPELEAITRQKAGRDFDVYFYPEFLREGSALKDFDRPSLNIVGALDGIDAQSMGNLFPSQPPLEVTSLEAAEMIKYVNNSFHALKVCFANEVGAICKRAGLNTEEIFRHFLSDRDLNISERYLKPGAPFGGSCLVKELQFLDHFARSIDVRAPLLNSIMASNVEHTARALAWATNSNIRNLGIFGASFKPDTDDIRESPMVEIISKLLEQNSVGQITIFDFAPAIASLKAKFSGQIEFAQTIDQIISHCDALILGPLPLCGSEKVRLLSFPGPVLDLNWHPAPEELVKKVNYQRLC